jgi:hypothetical protein
MQVSPVQNYSTPASNPSVAEILLNSSTGWHGSITYSFEFICSVFHRATFLLVYSPNTTEPTYEEALASLENINVTVSGNTHVKWTIPWRQAAATSSRDRVNGRIWIFLVDSVINNGSDDGIMLDVLAEYSECHFHFPSVTPLTTLQYAVSAYSSDWIESSDFSLIGDSRTLNGTIAGGDTVRSVKDLVSRAALIDSDAEHPSVIYRAGALRGRFRSWFDVVAPWYYGWRSSFRYHGVVEPDKDNPSDGRLITYFESQALYTTNTAFTSPTIYQNAIQAFNPSVVNGFDVVVPYATFNRNFSPGQVIGDPSPGIRVRKASATDTLMTYRAAGDDFVAGFFLGVPRMVSA